MKLRGIANVVVIAAGLAAGTSGAALAAKAKPGSLTPQAVPQGPLGVPCANPAPVDLGYEIVTDPYHPDTLGMVFHGTIKNKGTAAFTPGAAPQQLVLWIKWPSKAPVKLKTVALTPLNTGATLAIQSSFYDGLTYLETLNQLGQPTVRLEIQTNARGNPPGYDCSRGNANMKSILAPDAGLLAAWGIGS